MPKHVALRGTLWLWAVVVSMLLAACGSKIKAPPEPPQVIRRADDAFRYREYADAVALYSAYTDVVDKDVYTARTLYKKALAQYQLGRYNDVLITLQDLQNRYPQGHWVQVDALRGDAERALGQPVAAIESWDSAWRIATEAERTRLRVRIGTVAHEMNAAELQQARALSASPEVKEILNTQLARVENPELNEPMPEFAVAPEGTAEEGQTGTGSPAAAETAQAADTQGAVIAADAAPADQGAGTETGTASGQSEAAVVSENAKVGVLLAGNAAEDNRVLDAARLSLGEARVVTKQVRQGAGGEAEAVRDLLGDPDILAVIGPVGSVSGRRAADAASAARLPLLDLSSAEGPARPYVLRAGVDRDDFLPVLLDYAIERVHLQRFGVVYPDNATGRAFFESVSSSVSRHGGQVVGHDAYAPGANPVNGGLVRRWREKDNIQGVILADGSSGAETFAKFLQNEMPDIPLLGIDDWDAIAGGEGDLDGVVFASVFVPDTQRLATRQFVDQFEAEYHRQPGTLEALAYEAAELVKGAFQGGADSRRAVWRAIDGVSSFEGPTGDVRVAGSRLERQTVLARLVDGKVQAVEPWVPELEGGAASADAQ